MTAAGVTDVVIVGAGDVGTAIARELSHFELDLVLLEAGPDVGAGTSKANTAILHTGFDTQPGSLEARLVVRGHELLLAYARETGIPVETTGALLVAWDEEQARRLPQIAERAARSGYSRMRAVDADELYRREPHLGPGACAGLEVPDEHIVCPFTPPLAFATEALSNACRLLRGTRLTAVRRNPDGTHELTTTGPTLRCRWLINAAGLGSDEVDRMLGHERFTIHPRRGELIVFDKLARPLVSHTILPVPTERTKGVLVAPTVFGNVMLGPTADDIDSRDDTATTAAGLSGLLAQGRRILPALADAEVTATYAGLRAATEHSDYQLHVDGRQRYACAGGIRSTGLTASMAIAEYLRDELDRAGLALRPRPPRPAPRMANIGQAGSRPYAERERIAANPNYGRIVCFCERVTEGEIIDAVEGPIPPADLDGLRRRTRALMGRCQGFYCSAHVTALLSAAARRAPNELQGMP